MENQKDNKKKSIGPSILFGFVGLCTLLILWDLGTHMIAVMML